MKRAIGRFVWTFDAAGVGKLVDVEGESATISFFHSIAREELRTYPDRDIRLAVLAEQTRVYWKDPDTGEWHMGRVTGPHQAPDGPGYWVKLPNDREVPLLEQQLFTRCWDARIEPTEVLVSLGLETQFLHDRRLGAVAAFLHLRAASRGMAGLLSSAIDLVPHQVEVARRVLEDPIQRYLLADEVGLGKTIEAGVVIRQCLLDDDSAQVVVLVPSPLVHQWECELRDKFAIADFGNRVQLLSFDQIGQLPPDVELLVVDEAHHLVGRNGADSPAYGLLAQAAHGCRRLLLLSATPVLGNEATYLALLHLLDGVTYRLEDTEAFRTRVEQRREYADNLVRLRPNQRRIRLQGIKENLSRLFPEDELVQRLAASIDAEDEEVRADTIRALKRHIAETYRLQQRLLRTRRKDIQGWELRPRSSTLTVDCDEDERIPDACGALEEWRRRAARSVEADSDGPGDPVHREALRAGLRARYVRFFEAAAGGAEQLTEELSRQRASLAEGVLATFPEDEALLNDLATSLSDEADPDFDRPQVARGAVELTVATLRTQVPTAVPKVVAFASSTELARAVHQRMLFSRALGREGSCLLTAGMSAEEVARTVEQFRTATRPRVLVCDRAGEEGLNLAFAGSLLYLDLPLSPSRMEQRIGRLDRYGREQTRIHHRFILPQDDDDSPWLAWKEVLEQGFGIFSQSLSEVQFVLEELEVLVADALFERGAHGLRGVLEQARERLRVAREDLDREAEFDRMELDQRELSPLYEALDEADTDEARFIRPIASWWHEMLHFDQWRDESRADTFFLGWGRRALLPHHPWKAAFDEGLNRRLTFRRHVAKNDPEVRLVRPGVPFVDQHQRFLAWDDRGTAFATWRQSAAWPGNERGPWLGFKLAYVVEANAERAVKKAGSRLAASLGRRLDGLFSPWLQVQYVDLAHQEIVDPELLGLLTQGYYTGGSGAYRDYNLGSRREALFAVVDPGHWASLCAEIRAASEDLLRGSPRFQEQVRIAVQRAEDDLRERNERLQRRAAAVEAETRVADRWISEEIQVNESILAVVGEPRLRLDSIGFLVVSNEPPPNGPAA